MILVEKPHIIYFIGLIIISIITIIILVVLPRGTPVPELSTTFFLLGLGLNSTLLLWTIGGYLLFRWLQSKRKNPSLLIWSISFFLYSITFVAHIFRAFGIVDANENTSVFHFFTYRWGMVVWAGGMIYGLLKILTDKKKFQIYGSVGVLGIGFLSLILGLFVIPTDNPIEFTMYIFLHIIWIPICFTMSYIFFYYGYKTKQLGPKILGLGFFLLMVSYYGWAPWHFSNVVYLYFLWYFIFVLSLTPILMGFVIMSIEEK